MGLIRRVIEPWFKADKEPVERKKGGYHSRPFFGQYQL